MTERPDVAHLRDLGFDVFPCAPDKRPRVRWQDDPPDGGWKFDETDLIGVRLPVGTVVLDVDNQQRFRDSGLAGAVTPSVYSPTRRDGGLHVYYTHTGGVDQFTDGTVQGFDTRVGGKGYVIAWHPEDWKPVSEWKPAPAFLYNARPSRATHDREQGAPMGTRLDILSFLGMFSARGISLTPSEYLAILKAKRESGGIISLDQRRPWTDDDLHVLADEAAKWEVGVAAQAPVMDPATVADLDDVDGMDASDLQVLDIPDLRWAVAELIPEGFGILASPPKVGKSLLCYQLAVCLTLGEPILGLEVEHRAVRYYALEDGKRRSKSRLNHTARGRRLPRGLEVLWNGPKLGGPMEKEAHEWLQAHPMGVIIIDVLSKVRPEGGKGKGNAYDEDYALLSNLHKVAKYNPGSVILVVTHDRKAGGDDWMTRITGTRGIPGVADFSIFINRKRGEPTATISATGRDQADKEVPVVFNEQGWEFATRTMLDELARSEMSDTRGAIVDYLKANEFGMPASIGRALGIQANTIQQQLKRMANLADPLVISVPGIGWRLRGEEDDDADE